MSQQQRSQPGSARSSVKGSDRGSQPPQSARSSKAGSARSQPQSATSSSPRSSTKGRHNKLYRTPPTPPPEEHLGMERGFTLDCIAVSSVSQDYSKTNPKLGPVVPPYNSQKDRHVSNYYGFQGVDRTLRKTEQDKDFGTSIEGPVQDRFHNSGPGFQYVTLRNQFGAGHSRETIDGHAQFMQGLKPVLGYNGQFGYRRNTPWLRASASPFGTASHSPTH